MFAVRSLIDSMIAHQDWNKYCEGERIHSEMRDCSVRSIFEGSSETCFFNARSEDVPLIFGVSVDVQRNGTFEDTFVLASTLT